MKPYSEEELSRILGEHDSGQLRRGGYSNWHLYWHLDCPNLCLFPGAPVGCVNQAAYNEDGPTKALGMNRKPALWFDNNYDPEMSPEALLDALESA